MSTWIARVVLLAVLPISPLWAQSTKAPAAPRSVSPDSVSYRVVETWSIPNGGFGRAIVVPARMRNEASLRALGLRLRADTKADRNAFIFVFDSERAAGVRRAVVNGRASDADLAVYDKHFIAVYNRNANTGFHEMAITLRGCKSITD